MRAAAAGDGRAHREGMITGQGKWHGQVEQIFRVQGAISAVTVRPDVDTFAETEIMLEALQDNIRIPVMLKKSAARALAEELLRLTT